MRTALPPSEPVETDVGVLLMPSSDQLMRVAMSREGVWEPQEGAVLRRLAAPGMTVLDVGAHCGYFTLMLSRLVGSQGQVVAVEPAPDNFALLVANVERSGASNVHPINAAAWRDSGGAVPLSLSDSNTGDHRAYRWNSGRSFVEVEALALDDLDPPLERLDVVKLDTQGTEHVVVEGLRAMLERHCPTMLVEFWPTGIRDLGDSPQEAIALYRELGYELAVVEQPQTPHDVSLDELVSLADSSPTEYVNLVLTSRPI